MKKTNTGLIEFVSKYTHNNSAYWYGTIAGQKATEALLTAKQKQYPNHYGAARLNRYRRDISEHRNITDCSGLIKGYLMQTDTGNYQYNSKFDLSANSMLNRSEKSGNISTLPEIPGIGLWRNNHVAVYLGNGIYKEAAGYSYGIREGSNINNFVKWFYIPYISYEVDNNAPIDIPIDYLARCVIAGKYGNYPGRKTKLNSLGYGDIYNVVQARVNELLKK